MTFFSQISAAHGQTKQKFSSRQFQALQRLELGRAGKIWDCFGIGLGSGRDRVGIGSGSGQDRVGVGLGLGGIGSGRVGIGSGLGQDWVGIGSGLGRDWVGIRLFCLFFYLVKLGSVFY
jgi:hypothetical protein